MCYLFSDVDVSIVASTLWSFIIDVGDLTVRHGFHSCRQ
uniref:Uncharacterized protein n=1 Tax=Arundo donax TaxID=35708 RepID=A0A0A8YIC5_ARUDO